MNRFVLVAQARTAGHLLVDLLNSHSMIHCDNEPFLMRWRDNPFCVQRLIRKVFAGHYVKKRSEVYSRRAYGFKVLINQLFFPKRTLLTLYESGWRIIHLRRRNIVRQTASLLIARRTGQWHRPLEETQPRPKVFLEPTEFLTQLERQAAITAREKTLMKRYPHLTVDYENDLGQPARYQETLDRLFEYLLLPSCKVKTRFALIHPGTFETYIQNYAEISQMLAGTKYANLLDA